MMSLRAALRKAALLVLHVHFLASLVSSQTFTTELSRKYFTDVSMLCDDPVLNLTARSDIRSMAWIFPDGETFDSARRPDPKLFTLTGPRADLAAYNLTALGVSDPVFGYYICVVVYQSEAAPISVIKWGLNVQGADFSELLQTYEENAIVGGIAAAVMLVLIAVVCLLWHFRYSNRHHVLMTSWEGKSSDDRQCLQTGPGQKNEAYMAEDEVTEMEVKTGVNGNNPKVHSEMF